jgi:SAM-dependent methyltransferase/8-oxo-dGTP pyrophosphatase MutT (NUDIX family)
MMSAMTTTWDAAAFDAFERSGWAGRSEAYESGFARLTAHTVGPLLDAAGVTSGTAVLDVGTGPGIAAAAALARGAVVTAVDASPEMAALAAAACPGADVHTAILPELPFPDGSFDAVVGNFVINHLGDAAAGLAELHRVLRPGGRIALTCWEKETMRATAVFGEAIAAVGIPQADDLPSSGPFLAGASDRPTAFRELLAAADFTDARARRLEWTHPVHPDDWWSAVVGGTPLTGSLIARQSDAVTAEIKRRYDALVAPFAQATSGLVGLPAVAILGSGRKAPELPGQPGQPLSTDEILDIVDAEDNVIGQAPRGEATAKRLRHRCVFILARDADDRIFVHRRTAEKLVFPSMHDMFVGGVVGAGETYDEAAKREAEEELGVSGLSPVPLFRFLYESPEHTWWSAVYETRTSTAVAPQPEEVAWHTFLTESELAARLSKWEWVPDGLDAWRRLNAWRNGEPADGAGCRIPLAAEPPSSGRP